MEKLTVSENTLNKYFSVLNKLDNNSKKKLIIKLTKSINTESKQDQNINSFFGAWQGNENAEEIIDGITESRYNNRTIEKL